MKQFRDAENRVWNLAITVASLTRVRDLAGIDLTDMTSGDPPAGARLTSSLSLVGDVLAAILNQQLTAQGVSRDEFLDSLDGPSTAAAFDALTGDLGDFFLSTGRTEQAKALTAQLKVLIAAVKAATARIESLDVDELVNKAFSHSAGNSPA